MDKVKEGEKTIGFPVFSTFFFVVYSFFFFFGFYIEYTAFFLFIAKKKKTKQNIWILLRWTTKDCFVFSFSLLLPLLLLPGADRPFIIIGTFIVVRVRRQQITFAETLETKKSFFFLFSFFDVLSNTHPPDTCLLENILEKPRRKNRRFYLQPTKLSCLSSNYKTTNLLYCE